MIKNSNKEIQDIIDIIIDKFGYDKEEYFEVSKTGEYAINRFCRKLSVDTFNNFVSDGSVVLFDYNFVNTSEIFRVRLRFGYPRDTHLSELSNNISKENNLYGVGFQFENCTIIDNDLSAEYKELLRNRELDKLLT